MFMNKNSMSQTCLYNISYKKATCVPQQPVAMEGLGYSTQSSDSRRLLDGVRVQASTSIYYDSRRD